MANAENLKPHRFKAGEGRAAESGRRGGLASAEAKRERRTLREVAEAFRDLPPPKWARTVAGVACDTYGAAAVAGMFAEAAKGNPTAYRAIIETLGEIDTAPRVDVSSPLILGMIPADKVEAANAAKRRREEEDARERRGH